MPMSLQIRGPRGVYTKGIPRRFAVRNRIVYIDHIAPFDLDGLIIPTIVVYGPNPLEVMRQFNLGHQYFRDNPLERTP